MTDSRATAHRPVGVTILVVLLWIQAVISILAGIVLIIENNDDALLDHVSVSSDVLVGYGIGLVIVGAITAVVASALGRGSTFAQTFAAVITAFNIGGAIYSFLALDGVTRANALFQIIVGAVILYILYGEKGSQEFFRR